jgi:hypothetical protein
MLIPPFDSILNVLPPHVGDPRKRSDLSPYPCTVVEFCQRFATSSARKKILDGLLNLRAELLILGIQGFQWLDGSFLENIEQQEGRDPEDIDVVTFVEKPLTPQELHTTLILPRQDLWIPDLTKFSYLVDHYLVSLGTAPLLLVDNSTYWYALFSHRRDKIWKGMVKVELGSKSDDDAARIALRGMP